MDPSIELLIYLAGLVIAIVSLFAILRLFSIDKTMKAALTELQHFRRIQGVMASESGLEEVLECGECKTQFPVDYLGTSGVIVDGVCSKCSGYNWRYIFQKKAKASA